MSNAYSLHAIIFFLILAPLMKVHSTCDGVIMGGVYHEKEVLATDLDRPYQISVDYFMNVLYFSIGDQSNSSSGQLNLETKKYSINDDLPLGFAHAVDQKTHNVYVGSGEGLLIYDPLRNGIKLLAEQGTLVLSVFFKDILYYTTSNYINTFVEGKPRALKGFENRIAFRLVVDNENDVIFFNWGPLYRQKLGTRDMIQFQESDQMRALGTDIYGKAYVCRSDGIYTLNKCNNTLVKLLELDEPLSITFDRNNHMIYSDAWGIYRLTPNPGKSCS